MGPLKPLSLRVSELSCTPKSPWQPCQSLDGHKAARVPKTLQAELGLDSLGRFWSLQRQGGLPFCVPCAAESHGPLLLLRPQRPAISNPSLLSALGSCGCCNKLSLPWVASNHANSLPSRPAQAWQGKAPDSAAWRPLQDTASSCTCSKDKAGRSHHSPASAR